MSLSSPDLHFGAAMREWSQPLPPEQWLKRSPELERVIAEREAELRVKANIPQHQLG